MKGLHNLCIHLGLPSPSGRTQPAVSPRGQSFGQRIMGNMMDNLLVRSLTSKSKGRTDDIAPPSPVKVYVCSFLQHMLIGHRYYGLGISSLVLPLFQIRSHLGT
jgi:hypothetical protein